MSGQSIRPGCLSAWIIFQLTSEHCNLCPSLFQTIWPACMLHMLSACRNVKTMDSPGCTSWSTTPPRSVALSWSTWTEIPAQRVEVLCSFVAGIHLHTDPDRKLCWNLARKRKANRWCTLVPFPSSLHPKCFLPQEVVFWIYILEREKTDLLHVQILYKTRVCINFPKWREWVL